MDNVLDIELINMDLHINNGDFVATESDGTHIEHILLLGKGNLKHSPITGVGLSRYLNSPDTVSNLATFKRKLIAQLEYDGFTNVTVDTSHGLADTKIAAKRI